jgi:DNA (cytosine-5)-methyltransferase 1
MTKQLTFGSLFAGIGGFDLGFERAGMACKWQVEIGEYGTSVLAKHWPGVRRHDDVRTFPPTDADEWRVDAICGGFPCQDISNSGHKAGIDEGLRSGLWREYARIIRTLRPRFVVVENVAALLGRGLNRVLGDLAQSGYDAEWDCLPACEFGADHERDRAFIAAYPKGCGWTGTQDSFLGVRAEDARSTGTRAAEPLGGFLGGDGWQRSLRESGVAPFVHGLSARLVDKPNRAVGNAVCPPVAEWIGRRIVEAAST